eukprot:7417150-Pyramimonas_sp.AAC.1
MSSIRQIFRCCATAAAEDMSRLVFIGFGNALRTTTCPQSPAAICARTGQGPRSRRSQQCGFEVSLLRSGRMFQDPQMKLRFYTTPSATSHKGLGLLSELATPLE